MKNKPNLTLITTTPATVLPLASADDFKYWVLDEGLKPSVALRKMMDKYNCPEPDTSVPIQLVELTYPDIEIYQLNFTYKIHDSGYPNSDTEQFSDQDFDDIIEQLISLPKGG